jgi:sialate O-acetylesterase
MKLLRMLPLLTTSLVFTAVQAHAEAKLPKLFSSHMVLQRDMPIHVWGEANPGEQVAVTLQNSSGSATADKSGRWSVYLAARPAGGPFTLSVHASNTLHFDDILIGDLWMASGQSNMELPLKGYNPTTQVQDSAKEIANASYPQIRLFLVQHDASDYPLSDVKAAAGWSVCSPDSATDFSAVAYFFGRAIQQKENVPVGLIDASWGGSPADAWTSMDTLAFDASLLPVFGNRATRMNLEAARHHLEPADAQADAAAQGKPRELHPGEISWQPAALYNAMIAPFTPLPIRGVIWYQGESNAQPNLVALYRRLFPAMIQDWRTQWHQEDLPFLFVQLASYQADPKDIWGVLREAQRHTLYLANTGMAITIDIGNEHNVHPADKQDVGARLALLARSIVYGENVVSSGPLFRLAYPEGNSMHVWFNSAAGLKSQGAPETFEVAGADGVFSPANAKIEGDTVTVSSPTVPEPRYVRYAWANYAPVGHQPNLYNAAGLPASPFTSYPTP